MMRLISDRPDIKQNKTYYTFFSKLKHLIIMSKAFLNGHPIEEQLLKEIIQTAGGHGKITCSRQPYERS